MHFCWNCEITDSFAIQVQWYILKPVFWVSCLCFSMLLHCHLYLEWGYPKHEDGSPGSYFCSIKKSVMVCFLPERKGCWPFNHLFLNVAPMIRFVFVFCVRTHAIDTLKINAQAPKCFRAQFLCLLNRAAMAEAWILGWPRVRASQELVNSMEILPK